MRLFVAPIEPRHWPADRDRRCALLLAALGSLFFLRVAAQAFAAASGGAAWLPRTELWLSGLIPYPVLLPLQIAILVFLAEIAHGVWTGSGVLAVRRPGVGRWLWRFGVLYAAITASRWLITRGAAPWLSLRDPGDIPPLAGSSVPRVRPVHGPIALRGRILQGAVEAPAAHGRGMLRIPCPRAPR